MRELHATVNNQAVSVAVEDYELLLDVVRDKLGLKGAKRSCDLQVCGTCTMLLDGVAVSACTTLAVEMDGADVTTVEGLAVDGKLTPVQRAMVDLGALQCGFCTPGVVITAESLLAENPRPTREEVKEYFSGTICRCTGYQGILDAVLRAADDRVES